MAEAGAQGHNLHDLDSHVPQSEQADLDVSQPESPSVNRKLPVARLPVAKQTPRRGKSRRADKRADMLAVEPVLLTRAQAAELAQVSLSKLDQWSREPGCPVIREGGHFVRFPRDLFVAWLDQRIRPG